MNILIRKITEIQEILPILDLMQQIWQLHDREIVASFEMKAIAQFGLVLGAYDLDEDKDKPIGFIYAFNKFPDVHYSHMMGMEPSYQGKNVGYLLKKMHRELALESRFPPIMSIEWTVDPLLSINAGLNFRKLGVICNEYHEDFYGTPSNVGLYPALPTDRILVTWLIRSQRVEYRFSNDNLIRIPWKSIEEMVSEIKCIQNERSINEKVLPPPEFELDKIGTEEIFALEVPNDITKLSKSDFELAIQWRLITRKSFQAFFKLKYFAVDFLSFKLTKEIRRNFYIFTRNPNDYEY